MTTMVVDVGTHHRELVAPHGQFREQFGETQSAGARGNGAKGTAKLVRSQRFWIEQIQMAGTTIEPDQHH